MDTLTPAQLAEQIAKIQRMERGKLSVMRRGPDQAYFKLQVWENGKNHSRYVPADQAVRVQEAIDGYHRFRSLLEQYAQQVINTTRDEFAAGAKKKTCRRRKKSSEPKPRKSSS